MIDAAQLRRLKKLFGLDAIYGCDWETYWASDFTLSKLATTEYVTDARFETQLVAVQKDSWKEPKVMTVKEFRKFAATVLWGRCGFLGHHTQFDGLIASHHFGIKPKAYFDTLSMARAVMPVTVPRGLDTTAKALGFKGKVRGQALLNVKGRHFNELSKDEIADFKAYAGDDISDTWGIFAKLLEYFPDTELKLIHITCQMYCQPRLLLDQVDLLALEQEIKTEKQRLMDNLNVTRDQLMSNDKFALLLEAIGVEPPLKYSEKKGEMTFAFSKQDMGFKELLESEDDVVRTLVEARVNVKSTTMETRARRMAMRASLGAQPIYLNYWGAGPGRWSGGDKSNWQNLTRGSRLRTAIHAPPGHELIIADLAQIEARINAWFALQQDVVDAFASGEDVYRVVASRIFNKPLHLITKDERFIGKCCVLALGYGAGWQRFATMLRIGALGPSVNISDRLARDYHQGWRSANPFIVGNWRKTHNFIKAAFVGKQHIADRCVAYQGVGEHGFMHMPGGMAIRYDHVLTDPEGNLSYTKRYRVNKVKEPSILIGRLYGGLEVENRTQGLARQAVAEQMVEINDTLPYWQQAMTTHDEIVGVVPTRYAKRALEAVKKIMSTAPTWAPGLPLAVDAHRSMRYDK